MEREELMEQMKELVLTMLEERRFKELKDELETMHPVDVAEMLEEFDDKQKDDLSL